MGESSKSQNNIPLEDSIPEAGASLESILCTEELRIRPSRPPDYEKENRALVGLMSALTDSPSTIFQTLAETILDITQCDSAGLSLLTRDGKTPDVCGQRFYWPAIAGMWNPHAGGGTPRNFGPCGDVLDQNRTLLFRHFERRYPYLVPVIPASEECLVVPFYVAGQAVGTIWAIMHSDRRKFDAEDDRVMASLEKFASSAYQALLHIEDLKFQEAEREKAEAEVRELAKGLEAKVRPLVGANVVGIVIWNLEGAITEANEAFLRMVQYDREDLASGRVRWTDLTPVEWRGRDERAIVELKASGIFQPFEKEYFRKDGSRVPVLLGGALFERDGNEGVGFVLDLTEQKRAEGALRRSEAYLAQAQKLSGTGSWHLNVSTGEVLWSEEFCAIFGFDSRKDKGSYQLYLERIHPEDRLRVAELRSAAVREKRDFGAEYRLLLPGGLVKYVDSVGHFSVSEVGNIEYIGAVRDITEQKHAQRELLALKDELAAELTAMTRLHELSTHLLEIGEFQPILEEALDATIALQNADFGNIQLFNQDTQALEIVAQRGFHQDFLEYFRNVRDGGAACGRAMELRERVIIEDVETDSEFAVHRHIAASAGFRAVQSTPLFSRSGEFLGMLSTHFRRPHRPSPRELRFTDLYARHAAEIIDRKRLHEARGQAEQALHMTEVALARVSRLTTMGELAASIAHEVNQPLTAVSNNANACLRLLASRNLEPKVLQRALQEIVADCTRTDAVITRIRAFIRKTPAEKSELNINDVIQEVLALAEHELQKNRVLVERHLTKSLPLVRADRIQLQQVLLNLIKNGTEAMSGVTLQSRALSVQSRIDESGRVLVAVRDSGTGLGSEADRLFSPFFTTKANGMGMGLTICRSIIESHGGRLWAAPNSPHGAVFSFTLPVGAGNAP